MVELAYAGPALDRCKGASKSSVAACKAAEGALKAADAARSSQPIKQGTPNLGSRLGADTAAQAADVAKALSACESAQKSCESACDSATQEAQADMEKLQMGLPGPSAYDEGPIAKTKKNECQKPLEAEKAKLNEAKNNLNKDNQASKDSEGSSNAPPPMPPPPQNNNDQKPEEQAKGPDCTQPGSARFSECNDEYMTKCQDKSSSGECSGFVERFCNTGGSGNSGSGSGEGISLQTTGAKFAVDKKGEGVGSAFCQNVLAEKFCAIDGRSHCPSCKDKGVGGGISTFSTSSKDDTACATDPAYLSTPVTGGSTVPGAGSSGGEFGITPKPPGGVSDEYTVGNTISEGDSGGVGGAGGGGFTPPSGELPEEGEREPAAEYDIEKGILPASSVAGMPADVSNQYGPSLFSISTDIYRKLCSNDKLNNCAKSK